MNPTHTTRRLSLTLAGLAAAALALPACQGTATAASHRPPSHAAQATAQQKENGLTVTDLKDLAKMKRDLFQRLLERSPRR
jgi:hypothetical protein